MALTPGPLLKALADKCPKEPLALLFLEPYNEFGEYLIIELTSKESEYGEEDNARLRLTPILARGLAPGRNPPPGPATPPLSLVAVEASKLK